MLGQRTVWAAHNRHKRVSAVMEMATAHIREVTHGRTGGRGPGSIVPSSATSARNRKHCLPERYPAPRAAMRKSGVHASASGMEATSHRGSCRPAISRRGRDPDSGEAGRRGHTARAKAARIPARTCQCRRASQAGAAERKRAPREITRGQRPCKHDRTRAAGRRARGGFRPGHNADSLTNSPRAG